ncbi:large subunit ribosomal protein 23 (apicoplast) [Plasmodium gonderi]|uniref:Large subunit ribosomal protein 23 n=1 Tax=Plasmodium gonderi TaxID=77519 RepID=A0A1Y1JYB5_PLAGO|nr:large subunit ribosomal protein 23 [Plasmodium gonderi]BBB58247.1 large subunit ribosomal protein 23 [Plasmodium gonderi]GAW84744.1 large subunit ribosomal protein 23 [Plasmodium gonderi]
MKEVIFNFYLNNIFYKINFITCKYCIIYTSIYITKLNIKYIINHIFKNNFYIIKIKYIVFKNKYKKYNILFK